jgi:hypothetical protein
MRRVLTGAVLAAAAVAAPPASAASIALDRSCYLARQPGLPLGQRVTVSGSGFAPNAPLRLTLGARPLSGTVVSGPAGTFAAGFNAPAIARFQETRTLAVGDGATTATAAVRLSRLAADFLPATGNPLTLRVRFYLYGFGPVLRALRRGVRQPVYMHVFRPNGRRRAVFFVGFTSGPCGYLRTGRRPILPFTPEDGRWRYVFTTHRRYSRTDAPQASVAFVVSTELAP